MLMKLSSMLPWKRRNMKTLFHAQRCLKIQDLQLIQKSVSVDIKIAASVDFQSSESIDNQPSSSDYSQSSESIDAKPSTSVDTLQLSEQPETEKSKSGGRTTNRRRKRNGMQMQISCHQSLCNVKCEVLSIECAPEEVLNLLPRLQCYVIQS